MKLSLENLPCRGRGDIAIGRALSHKSELAAPFASNDVAVHILSVSHHVCTQTMTSVSASEGLLYMVEGELTNLHHQLSTSTYNTLRHHFVCVLLFALQSFKNVFFVTSPPFSPIVLFIRTYTT